MSGVTRGREKRESEFCALSTVMLKGSCRAAAPGSEICTSLSQAPEESVQNQMNSAVSEFFFSKRKGN